MSNPNNYTVGWICALQKEFVAAQAWLDEEHEEPQSVSANDKNAYKLGRMGKHNVVIAVMPMGEYGLTSAATVATDLLHTFTNVRIGLMVGIAGGAPTTKHDVRLGDIVVSSQNDGQGGGVFEYDFGKTIQNQAFQHTRYLNQPPQLLRAAIAGLSAEHEIKGHTFHQDINSILKRHLERTQRPLTGYSRPDLATDQLYKSEYVHRAGSDVRCADACGDNEENFVSRSDRNRRSDDPAVHYGVIASANQLMKDAKVRDKLAGERNVLAFEMEAAGLMNHYPCIIIRGICDYADSHKNKEWQGYAAMTAAAYAKALLCRIPPNTVEVQRAMHDVMTEISEEFRQEFQSLRKGNSEIMSGVTNLDSSLKSTHLENWLSPPDPSPLYHKAIESRYQDTGLWFLRSNSYAQWKRQQGSFLWLYGEESCGKTVLVSTILQDLRTPLAAQDRSSGPVSLYFFFGWKDGSPKRFKEMIRSFILQLFKRHPECGEPLQTLFLTCQRESARTANDDELRDTFHKMVQAAGEVFLIIDGLDCCATKLNNRYARGALPWLKDFMGASAQRAHVLVSSCPDRDIKATVGELKGPVFDVEWDKDSVTEEIHSSINSIYGADSASGGFRRFWQNHLKRTIKRFRGNWGLARLAEQHIKLSDPRETQLYINLLVDTRIVHKHNFPAEILSKGFMKLRNWRIKD